MNVSRLSSGRLGLPVAMMLARLLPERPMLRLADALADRAAREDSPNVRAVRANQAVVRGLPPDDPILDRAVQAVFRSAGRGYVALYRALARGPEHLRQSCEIAPGMIDRIAYARHSMRGLVLVGPHLSAFDFFILTIAAHGYPMQALTPPAPTDTFKLQNELRTKYGAEATPASMEAVRAAIVRLKAGGIVGTGLDRPDPSGEWIEFFGRQAFLPIGFARLAVRTGALLLPGAMLPAGPGRYRAIGLELLEPPASRSDDAARALAREALRSVEPLIRTYADEWLMFHPVWPEG